MTSGSYFGPLSHQFTMYETDVTSHFHDACDDPVSVYMYMKAVSTVADFKSKVIPTYL